MEMFSDFHDWGWNWSKFNINSRDFKALFFDNLCRSYLEFIKNQDSKHFFLICKPDDSEFLHYIEYDDFLRAYFLNIKKIVKLLPINAIIIEDKTYSEVINEADDEFFDFLTVKIIETTEKNQKKSFKSLQSFLKTYDLTFLNKQVFSDMKTKFMFF